jgi:hypothetical protein
MEAVGQIDNYRKMLDTVEIVESPHKTFGVAGADHLVDCRVVPLSHWRSVDAPPGRMVEIEVVAVEYLQAHSLHEVQNERFLCC